MLDLEQQRTRDQAKLEQVCHRLAQLEQDLVDVRAFLVLEDQDLADVERRLGALVHLGRPGVRHFLEAMAAETEARENIEKEKKKSGQNMHARKRDLKVLKEAANRWTDNLFMIKSKLVESGADVKNVDGMLGTDRIDYIE